MHRMEDRRNGAALIVVLMMALLLSIIATSFVNFQIMDRRMMRNNECRVRAFMMADSGISYALCHICKDRSWQGDNKMNQYKWVCQDGNYWYGFRVDSYFNAFGTNDPASYMYLVRSTGVAYDPAAKEIVSKKCVRALIQCTNDYNWTHANLSPLALASPMAFTAPLLAAEITAMTIVLDLFMKTHFSYGLSFSITLIPPSFSASLGLHNAKAYVLRYYDESL